MWVTWRSYIGASEWRHRALFATSDFDRSVLCPKYTYTQHSNYCAAFFFYFIWSFLYLESFEMWCWRRMEKVSWIDHVRNEEVLLWINEQRNILHDTRKRKANLIGHILRRNCLLKQVIEGKIKGEMEVAWIRGRRRKKLLDDFKDRRG